MKTTTLLTLIQLICASILIGCFLGRRAQKKQDKILYLTAFNKLNKKADSLKLKTKSLEVKLDSIKKIECLKRN